MNYLHVGILLSLFCLVSSDYIIKRKLNAPAYEIRNAGTTDINLLKQYCDNIPYCACFSSDGWLRYNCTPTIVSTVDLYVKDPPPPPFDKPSFNVWPQVAKWTNGTQRATLVKSLSFFTSVGVDSDILKQALQRYQTILFAPISENPNDLEPIIPKKADASIIGCNVNVLTNNETLQYGTDESYNIIIPYQTSTGFKANITANTVYGMLRGLETFSQLVLYDWSSNFWIDYLPLSITDFPRYKHRALLVDSSRHFQPVKILKTIIDGMAFSKLNTLHWHLVDDQSYPYVSVTYPLLSQKGAYDPVRAVYKPSEVQDIIKYAKYRGIRVMPEFDMPAHTASWIPGYPFLQGSAICGFDPTLDSTYVFITNFIKEIVQVFPENYIHLGGDELGFDCWNTSTIRAWMASNNIASFSDLESYFENKVLKIASDLGAQVNIWQDPFNNGVRPQPDTIIEVWRGSDYDTLKQVLDSGYRAVMAGYWYLDHLADDWNAMYMRDINEANLTPKQQSLIAGGSACMWAEWVDENNIVARIFPRATAVAEVLWSPADYPKMPNFVGSRLHQWRCRMNRRGINVQPAASFLGDLFCGPL